MRVVLIGSLGSGKGTCASRLKDVWHVPHISTGDLFRKEIKRNSLLGKIVAHDVKQRIVLNHRKRKLKHLPYEERHHAATATPLGLQMRDGRHRHIV